MSTSLYTNMTEQVNFGRNSVFYLEDVIQIKATAPFMSILTDFS
jgi:hypothetical protein